MCGAGVRLDRVAVQTNEKGVVVIRVWKKKRWILIVTVMVLLFVGVMPV